MYLVWLYKLADYLCYVHQYNPYQEILIFQLHLNDFQKGLQILLFRPQDTFHFPSVHHMRLGPKKEAIFLDLIYKWFPLCMFGFSMSYMYD